jgi:uncharacterized protein (TIGR03032 family)
MSEPASQRDLANSDAATESPKQDDQEIQSVQSPSLGPLFAELGVSVVATTYQAGKIVIMRNDGGVLNTHFVNSRKPMGIAATGGNLAVGVLGEIVFYNDVKDNCAKLSPPEKHDACFVPRYRHLTGEIDIHEIAFGARGEIWFINTRFSALCTLQGSTSFEPVWRPPFVTDYVAEDRCHLNGLGMLNGRPRYVTALGESNEPAGWRDRKADGGVLVDLATGKALCRGLSMPHSPRWYAEQLWVCESGKGTLSKVNLSNGEVTTFFEFPGFTRGLYFYGPYAFVGLSEIRESATFSGIPIAEKARERNCGVWVVDIRSARLVGMLKFTQGAHEIFGVQVLPQTRFPDILDRFHPVALKTYFLPPAQAKQMTAAAVPRAENATTAGSGSTPAAKGGKQTA